MTSKEKFPPVLNVTVENEGQGEDEYLDPVGTVEGKGELGKDRLVAIYELKEFKIVRAKYEIEDA